MGCEGKEVTRSLSSPGLAGGGQPSARCLYSLTATVITPPPPPCPTLLGPTCDGISTNEGTASAIM